MAFDDADTSKHSGGEFLDTLWNVDGIRPERKLGSGAKPMHGDSKGHIGASSGKDSGKKSKGKKGRGKNNGNMGTSSGKKGSVLVMEDMSMSMSMSMSFFYF